MWRRRVDRARVAGVGLVYEEFEREIQAWRERYAAHPEKEIVQLFLLALEREQLVSVGYRETIIGRRLAAMPIPDDMREVVRHALLWTWKDEEMHAIYIRGALLRLGSPALKARTFLRQLAGTIGGWASSVRQHVRPGQAPLSWTFASAVSVAGTIGGKVPKGVRRELAYGPFRKFCLFNVEAEKTAARCWERLGEIGAGPAELSPALVADFRAMQADENRHRLVFEALAESFTDDDRLVPGASADALVGRIRAIGEPFLPRKLWRSPEAGGSLGAGGAVVVVRGESAADGLPLFRRLLEGVELERLLRERARGPGRDRLRVAIKPTFMIGYHRSDPSPITDPRLVEELARVLRELGAADVAVVEAPTIYDRFYRGRSVREVARYFGFESVLYRVVDVSEEQVPHAYCRGMAQDTVSRTWKEADVRISFAKMRSNPVDMVTLTVANLEGLGARHEEFFFAERQAQRATAIMMLAHDFPPDLALVDAYDSASDGLLGMMGNPRPKVPRRLYGGRDAMAVDVVAARHMGHPDPERSNILRAARQWFGGPERPIEVRGVDEPIAGWRGPYHNDWSTILSFLAYPVYEFGSLHGALFVPEMDEHAFPPIRAPGRALRLGRRAIQRVFGLRLPR